jgi:hypothetical protein
MRRTALVALALAALGTGLATVPVRAAVDDPFGALCQLVSTNDWTAEAGTQFGEVSGGPLAVMDTATGLPGSGTLTCRVSVNVADHTGSAPGVSSHGTGAVTMLPSGITYFATDTDKVYLCAEFEDDSTGMRYYFDAVASRWSTSAGVSCLRTTRVECVLEACTYAGAIVCVPANGCDGPYRLCVAGIGCNRRAAVTRRPTGAR